MQLDKDYSVERRDRYNIVIVKNTKNEQGEPYKRTIGYYGSLESALIGALRMKISTKDTKTILQSIKNAEAHIISEVQKIRREDNLL